MYGSMYPMPFMLDVFLQFIYKHQVFDVWNAQTEVGPLQGNENYSHPELSN